MDWPSNIYAATKVDGVYYTSNYVYGGTAHTWAAVNGGLPATDVRQFALDPFAPAAKQYCLLEATRTIYVRNNGGNWTSLLTSAQAMAYTVQDTGGSIMFFYCDESIPGRLWLSWLGAHTTYTTDYAMYSSDYGVTWTASLAAESQIIYYQTSGISALGDNVFLRMDNGANYFVRYSANKGGAWATASASSHGPWYGWSRINPLQPTKVHYVDNNGHHHTMDNVGAETTVSAPGPSSSDAMWFSASSAGHHRIVDVTKIYATTDSWATVNTPSIIFPNPVSIAPWAGLDEDQMIVGLTLHEHPGFPDANPHVIGVLYGEADVTAVGIAGTNCDTTPFADSIPDTCGGIAIGGIAAVEESVTAQPVPPDDGTIDIPGGGTVTLGGTANVQAVTMPGYTGDARGEPLPGDRGAWKVDTQAHAKLHAQDIKDEESIVHLDPYSAANGNAPVFNSTTGLFVNTDVLTPAEHTAIGDGAPHHAAVTLGVGSDAALALVGQVLTLTLPVSITYQTAVAAVILVAGDFVNLYNDGGTLKARFADCSSNRPADGYVLAGYAIGATATVYLEGHNTSLAGLTIGDMLYLSTIGDATATAPTTIGYIVQPIGQAFTATKAAFHREHTILLAT